MVHISQPVNRMQNLFHNNSGCSENPHLNTCCPCRLLALASMRTGLASAQSCRFILAPRSESAILSSSGCSSTYAAVKKGLTCNPRRSLLVSRLNMSRRYQFAVQANMLHKTLSDESRVCRSRC